MRAPRRPRHHGAIAFVVAAALAASCSGGNDAADPTTTDEPTTTTLPAVTTTATPSTTAATPATTTTAPVTTTSSPSLEPQSSPAGLRLRPPFSDYRWVPPLPADAAYAGPATPSSLDDVLLTPSQDWFRDPTSYWQPDIAVQLAELLEANGFAVQESGFRFFHDGYKSSAYESYVPIIVTTDALYHSWHLVFDKVLRDTEQERLLPTLERFLTNGVEAARAQEAQLTGTALADAAHRATAYYEAAATALGVDVGQINELAAAEGALIEAAVGVQTSPITGLVECAWPNSFVGCVDYSLFRPRGHYTRTEDLIRYFRGMSVLGLEGFALDEGIGVVPGLLVTRVILSDPELRADWTALYEPTAFLVGLADDIDPFQLAGAADGVAPGWIEDPMLLGDVDTVAIADAVLAEHPVAIDPERANVRVMGARFTLDSFILDQLAWPNVGREPLDERRVHVSALDVAAAFGSPLAGDLQLDTQSGYYRYEEQLAEMTDLVAARRPDDWAGTVYDAWLVALEPQFAARSQAYPDFMRTTAWSAKALQTGLASYTELKHDTVLYTKQGSGSEGEGPEGPDFTPRHWVEPDPVAFGRIAAAAALLRNGFAERDLLTPATTDLLDTLTELSGWLAGIAARELDGSVPTLAEHDRLGDIGSELEYLWIVSSEIELNEWGGAEPDWNERAGLVTDVFTTSFAHLQLGTGNIDSIYVIVPLGDGRFELAVGYVASYFEFWRSNADGRLTDEEWRAMLTDRESERPERPYWTSAFLATERPIADDWFVEF